MPRSRGRSMGRGFAPPHPTRGSGGLVASSPAGSGAEPRPKMDLVCFELNRMHLWQVKTSFWSTATHQQSDKFGTGFGIRDNSASRMTSYFFPGQALKIRDCPEKFGMDGHLNILLAATKNVAQRLYWWYKCYGVIHWRYPKMKR